MKRIHINHPCGQSLMTLALSLVILAGGCDLEEGASVPSETTLGQDSEVGTASAVATAKDAEAMTLASAEQSKADEASKLAEANAAAEALAAEKAKAETAAKAKVDDAKKMADKKAADAKALAAEKAQAEAVAQSAASAKAKVEVVPTVAAVAAPMSVAAEDDEREVLRVGIAPTYAPVIYKQGNEIFGMEADNARSIAEALERRLEFVEYANPAALIAAVNGGEVDVIMSGLTRTKARAKQVLFADSFVTVPLGVLIPADKKEVYVDGRALRGAKVAIGVKENTTAHSYAQTFCYGGRDQISFISQADAAKAVLSGKLGYFIHDMPSVRFIASANEGELDFLDFDLQSQPLAWAVSLKNKKLLKSLNKVLKGWAKSGELQENVQRWLPNLGEGIEGEDRVGRQPAFTAICIKTGAPHGTVGTVVIDGNEKQTREIDIGSANWEMFYLLGGEHELVLTAKGFETSTHKFKSSGGRPTWKTIKVSK